MNGVPQNLHYVYSRIHIIWMQANEHCLKHPHLLFPKNSNHLSAVSFYYLAFSTISPVFNISLHTGV
jgi:hypothetical protein